jgi:phosphatidate phosphatase APP1
MPDWKNWIAAAAGLAEEQIDALKRRLDARIGSEPLHIAAYDGFGTPERLSLTGRVLEAPGLRAPAEADSAWRNLANMYRRFESDEIAGARVRAHAGGASYETRTDEEGFFSFSIAPAEPLPATQLWHAVALELLEPLPAGGEPVRASGRVLVPPAGARFGVISDIDDTVIRTDATSLLGTFRSTMLANARTRLPFPGVAALYRALHGAGTNPLFYVSSSPWNIYDMLSDVLALRGIPAGPLLLRNWGLERRLELAFRHHDHKFAAITRILETYPQLRFLLIGDSGQEDPEIYREVIARFPGRILAVYIRNVTSGSAPRTAAIQALAQELAASGSTLILADDTLGAARHAHAMGWISDAELDEVAAAVAGEQAAPPSGTQAE